MHIRPALILVAVLSSPQQVGAQQPAGLWVNTTETPAGENQTTLILEAYDGELLGSFRNSFVSAALPIQDGRVDGDRISFRLQLRTRLLEYEGTVDGDELVLSSRVVEGEPFDGVPEVSTISLRRSENVPR